MSTAGGGLVRDLNRARVLNLVRERPGISRAEISRTTGLSPSTVTSIAASLLADELLVEEEPRTLQARHVRRAGMVGRPATHLRVDPGARHVLGVKLAPETLTMTVTDLDATPLAMVCLPHGVHARREEIGDIFESAAQQVLAGSGLRDERPLGIGVGVPGSVDPASGRVSESPLPEWAESGLADILESRLRVPALIDNDVNTLTIAEHLFGAGRGVADLLVVSIGRGIGMGAVVEGSVVRGWRGALGELGHVRAVRRGRRCWCGRRGCLETVAAEPAVVRDVLAAVGRRTTPDQLAAVGEEDERVAGILATAGRHVGEAMAMAISLLDPQLVIVSGEGVRLGARYLDALSGAVTERSVGKDRPRLVVEPWGDDAWARGAASLVLRELFHPAHLRDQGRSPLSAVARGGPSPAGVARMGQGGLRP